MKKQYRQLTELQRYQIQAGEEAGFSQTDIAVQIGCDKSTVSRELKRCRAGCYNAESSHKDAAIKRRSATKATRFTPALWQLILGKLACN